MIVALEFLDYDFMRRALLAAMLIGLSAPAVGIFLVQRRLALIGDGLGHIAVTGVALGPRRRPRTRCSSRWLTAIAGAIAIELIRARREAFGEIALAMLFYGGIAGGVVLVSRAPSGARNLNQYLFGSITTTSTGDLITFSVLAASILAVTIVARAGAVHRQQRRRVREGERPARDDAERAARRADGMHGGHLDARGRACCS